MLSFPVLYQGKNEALVKPVLLQAGPLSVSFINGELGPVLMEEKALIRRISMTVRDRDWGTIAPVIKKLKVETETDSFSIKFSAENKANEIDFFWQGEISGQTDGALTFRVEGLARSDFWRNRIGLCVLIPAIFAGETCRIIHEDGTEHLTAFPLWLDPDQPVQHFSTIKTLLIGHDSGLKFKLNFRGEIFEMEDQRNWTDASYKIYSTPLHLPYPVKVLEGTKISQEINFHLVEERSTGNLTTVAQKPRVFHIPGKISYAKQNNITFRLIPTQPELPSSRLGLGLPGGFNSEIRPEEPDFQQLDRLHRLCLDHFRLDIRLSQPDWQAVFQNGVSVAKALDLPLELAIFIPEDPEIQFQQFYQRLKESKPKINSFLVFPEKELYNGGSLTRQAILAARHFLDGLYPAATWASGTNTDYIFLARNPPPIALIDAVTFAIQPQAHAFDNESLVDSLEVEGAAVASARKLAKNKPVIVSPITLKPRFNPYATVKAQIFQTDHLPPQVDQRQMSLFGAAWTLGSLANLTAAGASSITYFETIGWRGVMEEKSGCQLPDLFHSIPGGVYPLYFVLSAFGWRGADPQDSTALKPVIPTISTHPNLITGLALRRGEKIRVLLANLTSEQKVVTISGIGRPAAAHILDETNVIQAMQFPESLLSSNDGIIMPENEEIELSLKPYAFAWLDSQI